MNPYVLAFETLGVRLAMVGVALMLLCWLAAGEER